MNDKFVYLIKNFVIIFTLFTLVNLLLGLFISNPYPLWKNLYDSSILSLIVVLIYFFIHTRKIKIIYNKYDYPYKVQQEIEVLSSYSLEEVKNILGRNINTESIELMPNTLRVLTKKQFSLSNNSWGEKIEIRLLNEFNDKFKYRISSKSRFDFTFNDLGNNLLLIDRLEKLIALENHIIDEKK